MIDEGLKPYLADSHDAWELGEDGSYAKAKPQGARGAASAQEELLQRLADKTAAGF